MREPHLDLAGHAADPPLLWDVGAVGQELGQHLEPGHDVAAQLRGRERPRLEHAVDPPANFQPFGPGMKMDVAGPGRRAPGQHAVNDLGRIAGAGRIEQGQLAGQPPRRQERSFSRERRLFLLAHPRPPSQQVSQMVRQREQTSFPRSSTSFPPQTGQAGGQVSRRSVGGVEVEGRCSEFIEGRAPRVDRSDEPTQAWASPQS